MERDISFLAVAHTAALGSSEQQHKQITEKIRAFSTLKTELDLNYCK